MVSHRRSRMIWHSTDSSLALCDGMTIWSRIEFLPQSGNNQVRNLIPDSLFVEGPFLEHLCWIGNIFIQRIFRCKYRTYVVKPKHQRLQGYQSNSNTATSTPSFGALRGYAVPYLQSGATLGRERKLACNTVFTLLWLFGLSLPTGLVCHPL
jgi:hypothetical protein